MVGRITRFSRLVALYASQGIPFGFSTLYVPLLLAGRPDFSYAKTTLFTLANFPWLLKMLWAPAADTHWIKSLGRRRSWILPAQLALAMTALAGTQLDFNGPMLPIFLFTAALNLWAAVQDTAVDALAVEMLPEQERGLGNAAQVGGYKLGMVVGGSWLTMLAVRTGPDVAMAALAGLVLLLMLVPASYREPDAIARQVKGEKGRQVLADTLRHLRDPGWIQTLLFVATVKIGESTVSVLLKPWLKREAGFSDDDAASAVGIYGLVASLVGSVVAGLVAGRMQRRTALVVLALQQAVVLVGFAFLLRNTHDPDTLKWAIAAEHFSTGLFTPLLFAYMMDVCDPRAAATQYTLLATVEVIAKGGSGALAGTVLQVTGMPVTTFMIVVSLAACLPLLLVPKLRRPFSEAV